MQNAIQKITNEIKKRNLRLPFLAFFYILAYICFELLVTNITRQYIFYIVLVVSSLYFSWRIGGRETMGYVGFFNIFFAFIFSRMLYMNGSFSSNLFLGRSFLTLYVIVVIFMYIMIKKKSPADLERKEREKSIEIEKQRRHQLELMVATEKLTDDMMAKANLVKDELMLLQNSWRSQIHTIINDLPKVKEKELYDQIVQPFEDAIISHLRSLESRLSFKPQLIPLSDLAFFLKDNLKQTQPQLTHKIEADIDFTAWEGIKDEVFVDKHKTGEIIYNIVRNSLTAMELEQIKLLRTNSLVSNYKPAIRIQTAVFGQFARIIIVDNGGGVSDKTLQSMFQRAIPSVKRQGKVNGQGTIFVKFFSDNMGFDLSASNIYDLGSKGLKVSILIPIGSFAPEPIDPSKGDI